MKRKEFDISQATSDQLSCFKMICDLVGGEHHISGKVYPCSDRGIECTMGSLCWASCDFDLLTRAILIAHHRAIRFEIAPCNSSHIKIYLHQRTREGSFSKRHPTIEQAINKYHAEYGITAVYCRGDT